MVIIAQIWHDNKTSAYKNDIFSDKSKPHTVEALLCIL
jgi:hypothetical protein